MNRRELLGNTLAASLLAGTALSTQEAGAAPAPRDYYELRTYRLASSAKQDRMSAFLRDVALPAAKRVGVGPIGVFVPVDETQFAIILLLVHATMRDALTTNARLASDSTFRSDGKEFLSQPPSDPAFIRMESSLLQSFPGKPKLQAPKKGPRLFELRTYESNSEASLGKKVEMFHSGEFEMFDRAGFAQVFYGITLAGPRQPNLTYMLSFADQAAKDKGWAAFGADPEWKKLSADPQYANTVSKVTSTVLKPTDFSAI
ncbi:MAG TPA: NIPSNAP family protein [Armatimonadota bacterium]|jgi:hypothetical protein